MDQRSLRAPLQYQVPPSSFTLEDLARAIRLEREAREAALADQQKHLDWRFVHFAEEFRVRLSDIEQRRKAFDEDCSVRGSPLNDEARVADDQRRHLQEGKLAILESRLAEVHRCSDALEAQLEEQREKLRKRDDATGRHLREMEAWLARADLRLAGLEAKVGKHLGLTPGASSTPHSATSPVGTPGGVKAAGRLTPVERVTLDVRPLEASHLDNFHLQADHHRGLSGSSHSSYRGEANAALYASSRNGRDATLRSANNFLNSSDGHVRDNLAWNACLGTSSSR